MRRWPVVIPNFHFHLSHAYAILRHNGVELGKGDFLGNLNWHDAFCPCVVVGDGNNFS